MNHITHRAPRACSHGFTLLEMAIVLVVLALAAGALVMPLAARFDASQRHAAEVMLDDAIDALIGFALLHGRLPCPSTEITPSSPAYGFEQGPPCTFDAPGYLPWRTLGLPAHDPWATHWRYRPDGNFVHDLITLDSHPGSHIKIYDHGNVALSTSEQRIVAVVYSVGPNRRADGRNAAAALFPFAPEFDAGEPSPDFDDALRWIGHPLLIARLARGGRVLNRTTGHPSNP